MTETTGTKDPATDATRRRLSTKFDELAESKGAMTELAKAALVDIDRVSLWRFRSGEIQPRLEVARRFAARLDCTVEDLWPDEES